MKILLGLLVIPFIGAVALAGKPATVRHSFCLPSSVWCINPGPTPTPTPMPGTYIYHGCQIYNGTAGVADPIANANVSATAADTNSSSVINHEAPLFKGWTTDSQASLEIVNLADNTTKLYTVQSNGHNPPITQGYAGGGAGAQVPWIGGTFKIEGTLKGACSGDCHWTTLNTQTCLIYEGGGGSWSGSAFSTFDGLIDDAGVDYKTQWTTCKNNAGQIITCPQSPGANKGDNWSVGGIPGLGFTDYGEELLPGAPAINHPIQFFLPTNMTYGYSSNPGFGYSPAGIGNPNGSCGVDAVHCIAMGDIVRFNSSVTCPTDSQANHAGFLLCNQLKGPGMVAADTQGSTPTVGLRFGLDTNGNDDTTSEMFTWLGSVAWNTTNLTIISRTALLP